MCNLYNVKTTGSELKHAFGPFIDMTNGASFDEKIYPDYPAPVIRNNLDGPELGLCRWGMPTPPMYVKGEADKGITNVRNIASRHWQQWLTVDHRCLVPATAFSEYGQTRDPETGKKPLHWFALDKSQPLFYFVLASGLNGKANAKPMSTGRFMMCLHSSPVSQTVLWHPSTPRQCRSSSLSRKSWICG